MAQGTWHAYGEVNGVLVDEAGSFNEMRNAAAAANALLGVEADGEGSVNVLVLSDYAYNALMAATA